MFKLKPNLEVKYQKFLKSAKPNSNTTLICAQLRMGGNRKNHAADFEFNKESNQKVVWNFINQTFLINRTINNYKIFITTDSKVVEQDGISVFGKYRVVVNEGPIKHIDRDLGERFRYISNRKNNFRLSFSPKLRLCNFNLFKCIWFNGSLEQKRTI